MKLPIKKHFIIIIFFIFFAALLVGCATVRPIVLHEGERRDYYSRYVSDTMDSIQRLVLYNESMTFELVTLSKGLLDIRANLLYYYGRYELAEGDDIIFYIFAKDPRQLQLLESSEQEQYSTNGSVVQRYHVITFSSKIIRLKSGLSHPLLHRYFGPIEEGKPPIIFEEV
jgi:hypothetical protein